MYTCQSGQQPPQVGNPSQYGTSGLMAGTQNKPPPHYVQVRADPNQPPPYMQVRADMSLPQNVQFTSHNGVYYNGQMSNDQALRNPQHGPTAARINTSMQTTMQTQTTNAQSRSHSLTNGATGLLKDLLMERNTSNYWPQLSPNGGLQPNVQNSLQSCASTPNQQVTIYNQQTVVNNYPATGYIAQQCDNAQTNPGQIVNRMARQPQSQSSTMNTSIQDAQILCNGTLESGVAYNQQLAQNRNHGRLYRMNATQHGSSHVASSNLMPSHQSFTSNNYVQMANSSSFSSNQMPSPQSVTRNGFTSNTYVRTESSSGASSSQMPSPQSFPSNGYTQMTNSSGASSNQMPSPQSVTRNCYTQMTNSSGASSNQMSKPQSFTSNGCTQMTNSLGAPSNQMSSSQSFSSNTCVQIANSAGASSSQTPSPQSFPSNGYTQMTNSSCASSNQIPSPQSVTRNGYTQMTNSSGASSNRMSSPQSVTINGYTQMTNSSGVSSNQMPSPQSVTRNGYTQMTNSSGASSNRMSSPQSVTINGYTQMTNSSGVSSNQMPSPQSVTSNGYTQMTNSSGASSNQMSSSQSFTSNGYTQMTNSPDAPSSQLSSPQSLTSNSYVQMANSSGAFLPPTSMTPQTRHSGRDNGFQSSIYPNGSQYVNHLTYSKMNSTNAFPVKNTLQPGNTDVQDNNTKCAPTEGYSIIKRLRVNKKGSQSSKQPTSETSNASAPVQKGFFVTVTEDKTGFKADNVIFLGNQMDTSRFTKESVQGSSSNYAQFQQFPGKISQQRNDKQPPLQSNAKLPETVGSTVKLVEQRAVAVVQPLSQTVNQVSSMQEHSQMIHGQCKNVTITEMDGNLEKSHISQHVKDDPRVCLGISSGGTKVSLIQDNGPCIVGTDITSAKLSVANTQLGDVVSVKHPEVTPRPQLSVSTEVSVSQTQDSEMQEDSHATDLSLVPTIPWTFDKLKLLTTVDSSKQLQSEDVPVIDLRTKVMHLFWGGRTDNLKNQLRTNRYQRLMAEVMEFMHMHVNTDTVIASQVDCSWDKIKDNYQVLNDDYVHPEVTYTSSWLNTNEQLDDIDKEFGFPQSLKYCPDELESDNQSKLGSDDENEDLGVKDIMTENDNSVAGETLGSDDETTQKEDSSVKDMTENSISVAGKTLGSDETTQKDDSCVKDMTENDFSVSGETSTDCIDLLTTDPFSLLEIHVMPPDEAKIVYEQVHRRQEKSETPADPKEPEENVKPDMQEFCCVIRCIAVISGKPDTKCQCKQKQDSKGLIMNTLEVENTERSEKLAEQLTEVRDIIFLSDDDDEMNLSFSSAEPKSISLPSTSSMAHSCSSSIIEKETEMETSVLTSEAEGHCGQAEKNATDRRHTPLGIGVGQTSTPTEVGEIICLSDNDDESLIIMDHSFSQSEPGSISLPSTSSVGHSCSSSIIEKGTQIRSSTNEVETTILASEVEDECGQAEQNPTDKTSEVEDECGPAEQKATDETSDVEDDCVQAEQNATNMTSDIEDGSGQAEQNPTDMTSDIEDDSGQAKQNPTDRGHMSFGIEAGQTSTGSCLSKETSDAKACFLKSLSLGYSHTRDPKKYPSLEGRPHKRKRIMGLDAMSNFQKKMKRCKQSSLSTTVPNLPLGEPKHGDKLSIQENNVDLEYITKVIPVKLALFGFNNGKQVLNARGINRDNCFSDLGLPPPPVITVYVKTRTKISPVVKVSVKPPILEDPSESQAMTPLQNLSVDTDTGQKCTLVVKVPVKPQLLEGPSKSQAMMPLQNLPVDTNTGRKCTLVVKSAVKKIFEDTSESRAITLPQFLVADINSWKKSTPVVKSPVKRHEGPSESSPTSVKQRIHNEWEKTVVPTRGKYKRRRLTSGNYMVTCSLSEGSPKKSESVQPTVCSERRLSRLSHGTEKKKRSLRRDIRKSILHGYKPKKNKSKESPVKYNKPSDSIGSKYEKRNHTFMSKERIVSSPVPEDGMESESEKRIILKFSVLPSTFNFKDGSTGTDSLDTPDLGKAQDRISKTEVKGPRGDWAMVPSKKYCPLPSTSPTVPKDTTTFHQFQKKYREAKQPSGDE